MLFASNDLIVQEGGAYSTHQNQQNPLHQSAGRRRRRRGSKGTRKRRHRRSRRHH